MKSIIAVMTTILAAAAFFSSYHQGSTLVTLKEVEVLATFEHWLTEFSRAYGSQEEKAFRFNKFRVNFEFIQEHNRRFAAGLETYEVGLNQFADMDRTEYKALNLGFKKQRTPIVGVTTNCHGEVKDVPTPPESVDWTAKGAVTPVKNQGQCGSCWAFSTTGSLEGLAAIEKGKLWSFSEQQLVDCAGGPYQNEGCNGGEMDAALWYVIDNGITTEDQYPYKARDQKCAYKDTMKAYQIKDCAEVPANLTAALVSAVVAQPVAIAVEADQTGFQFYRSGIFSGNCGTDLDHGILLVGYGTQGSAGYWKAKNSWGGTWGSQGYILLAKKGDGPGQCGIQMENTVPLKSA